MVDGRGLCSLRMALAMWLAVAVAGAVADAPEDNIPLPSLRLKRGGDDWPSIEQT